MAPIQSIAILGAGAMGALYASHFQRAGSFRVEVVARGERAERLRREGLVVNDVEFKFDVFDPAERNQESRTAGLVIVAVKFHHLRQALDDVAGLVGQQTQFLSVLNGLDSEELISELYGAGRVLYCVALGMDAVRVGNRVAFRQPGRLQFGEADNTRISERVERVRDALDRAGLAWETPVQMLRALWWKFMVNVGINQASGVIGAPYGAFHASGAARRLMDALMSEVIEISGRIDVNLDDDDLRRWNDVLSRLPAEGKTSMLQDIEAGRTTEVDMLAGKVIALGERFSVPTPYNRAVFHVLSAMSHAG